MFKLIVTLEGQKQSENELIPERDYTLGRGTHCDVLLPHPQISRQHAKLTYENGAWICRVTSKFGQLVAAGQISSELSLTPGSLFSIPPFDFQLVEVADQRPAPEEGTHAAKEATQYDKTLALPDRTKVVDIKLQATLFKLGSNKQVVDQYSLSDSMVAGRSPKCQIPMDDGRASRRHFSISLENGEWIVRDLDSANHTYVNDKQIGTHTLKSGDVISMGKDRFRFELLHPEFKNLPAPTQSPVPMETGSYPAVIKFTPEGQPVESRQASRLSVKVLLKGDKNTRIKVAAIALMVAYVAYSALTGNKVDEQSRNVAGQKPSTGESKSLEKMTPEQRTLLDETYNLALNLYTTGKYEEAALEIGKVLQQVPNYKDAKNIQSLCQTAIDLKHQQEESEQQALAIEANKQKVSDMLDECDILMKKKQYDKVADCVAPVKELDPENERAMNVEISARQFLEQRENSKEFKAEQNRKRIQAQNLYKNAKQAITEKRYPAALSQLGRVEKSDFPDKEGLKERAKQDIAMVKARMLKESQALVQEGKTSVESRDYGDAVKKFDKALSLAPFNTEAKTLRESAAKNLHQEMKNMYSESVIEENLGNIESAKKKWATILKQDEKSDQYYEKAQIKLRKYEK